jgi:biopolymer transport protein ExbB
MMNFYLWAQAAAATASSAPGETKPPDTFLRIVFSGGPIGIAIMLVLILTSMTALYLIIEQSLLLRRSRILPPTLGNRVRQALEAGRRGEAEQACQSMPSFLAFILLQGLSELESGWEAVEKALEDALAEQSARLFRRVEYLSVLANLAPMLGLLGTVVGMVLCFREVANTQGNAGAAQLAEGIYQALVTTVAGLMIAIPSLAAFALLRNRVDQFVAEAAYLAQQAFAPCKRKRAAGRFAIASASTANASTLTPTGPAAPSPSTASPASAPPASSMPPPAPRRRGEGGVG